jgi:hypothetical protein
MPRDPQIFEDGPVPADWKAAALYSLLGLGVLSLFRTSRVLTMALAGGLLYDIANTADASRKKRERDIASRRKAAERVDIAIDDSFPASDPPSYSGSTAGAPD